MSDKQATPVVMQLTQLAIAVGALGGLGGHFLAPDTTAAETTHKWTEAQFQQVVATQAKQHRDTANMLAFMKGYVEETDEALEALYEELDDVRPRRRGTPARKRRAKRSRKMPGMSAAPTQVKHQDLGAMLDMDESALETALHDLEAIDDEAIELEEEFQWDGPPELPEDMLPDGPPEGPPGPPEFP